MRIENITDDDYLWIKKEVSEEYSLLTDKEHNFFDKYKFISPKLYELEFPTHDDNAMFVVLKYKDFIILFDDIEELFSVGKINDKNKLLYNGTFTRLGDCIRYIQHQELKEKGKK